MYTLRGHRTNTVHRYSFHCFSINIILDSVSILVNFEIYVYAYDILPARNTNELSYPISESEWALLSGMFTHTRN